MYTCILSHVYLYMIMFQVWSGMSLLIQKVCITKEGARLLCTTGRGWRLGTVAVGDATVTFIAALLGSDRYLGTYRRITAQVLEFILHTPSSMYRDQCQLAASWPPALMLRQTPSRASANLREPQKQPLRTLHRRHLHRQPQTSPLTRVSAVYCHRQLWQ